MNKKFDPNKTIFLIDGSSFLYRAYYSLRPLHSLQGVPVQAVFGFCRMIKKMVDTFSPAYVALVWDSKGKTTRHEMYEAYKATRQAPPSDLFDQKEFIIRFADDIGLKQVHQQGIEADDIMYSIAQERAKDGDTVVLITSDKDMAQTLSDQIVIYDSFKEKLVDVATFQEEKGFPVSKLPFYFALLGDTSDNIPGVRGIGKAGAAELVKQFDSLQDLYNHLDDVKSKRMKVALEENKHNAFLSERLFLLQYIPTGLSKVDLAFNKDNWSNARELFQELNFTLLLQEIDKTKPTKTFLDPALILPECDLRAVTTQQELEEVCAHVIAKKICALDTETTGTDPLQDELVGISLCVQEGTAYYIPFGHKINEQQLERSAVLTALKPILEDVNCKKYLHNINFDELALFNAGIQLQGAIFDTMIAANLLTPEWQRNGLKALSMHYFKEQMLSYDDVVKAGKLENFSYVPLVIATKYAAADAHQTFKLANLLQAELATITTLATLYYDIEHPTIQILCDMEKHGIVLNPQLLNHLDDLVTKKLATLEQEIIALAGPEYKDINLNSPKQIEALLFTTLQLPPQKKSAKGTSYSTDQTVLEALAPLHPVPALIIKHRELFKLKSTYIDALPTYINPKTGRIHTTYSQVGAATGRLASYDPNLQNIPVTGYGMEIRAAFIPQEGHVFISADYSQIELRVLAYMSGDKNLTNAFLHGHDVHAQTAAGLFDTPLDKVTHEQRQIGKRINFSILYGLTPYGLSKDLAIPFKDAKLYIEKYFAQYPDISAWMEKTIEGAKEKGYVETVWGRRRYVPGLHERNKVLYEEARRIAINTPVQGTATGDIIKLGMIQLTQAVKEHKLDAHILLQIHDELLISVTIDQQEQAQALIKKVLEGVVDWHVPLQVTTRRGANWKEVSK